MNHSCSSYARGQCIDVEDGGSTFCFRVMESVCVVFVTIVGSQVEVVDFNLLGKNVETEPLPESLQTSFRREVRG